ncbi:MAG TPA: hypothetical protein VGK52_14115 [Polyangia bacterium]|jgi:hypothetical protein
MSPVAAVLSAWIFAQAAPPTEPADPAPAPTQAPAADETPPPPPVLAPPEEQAPPPPPPPPEPRAYGYAGMSELSLALGYSPESGVLGGAGFRRFVLDGLAPGLEASVQAGEGTTIGLVLGTLRLVPVRTRQLAFVLTGRAGRVLLSHHDDGWGAGGGVGAIVSLSPNVGLELGYDVLWLSPRSFCADLSSCTIQGPVIGLRLSF